MSLPPSQKLNMHRIDQQEWYGITYDWTECLKEHITGNTWAIFETKLLVMKFNSYNIFLVTSISFFFVHGCSWIVLPLSFLKKGGGGGGEGVYLRVPFGNYMWSLYRRDALGGLTDNRAKISIMFRSQLWWLEICIIMIKFHATVFFSL